MAEGKEEEDESEVDNRADSSEWSGDDLDPIVYAGYAAPQGSSSLGPFLPYRLLKGLNNGGSKNQQRTKGCSCG